MRDKATLRYYAMLDLLSVEADELEVGRGREGPADSGRGRWREVDLGEALQQLVLGSDCPVLVVHKEQHGVLGAHSSGVGHQRGDDHAAVFVNS